MWLKNVFIAVSGVGLSLVMLQAQATLPNYYECTNGKDVALQLLYFSHPNTSTISTILSLRVGNNTFSADEATIEVQGSVMGAVNTITTGLIPDVEINKASFIIPNIELGNNFAGQFISEVEFKSQLIFTTIATPFINGPYIGVVNNSSFTNLNCKAYLQLVP
jgi:hypothetical protein